MPGGNLNCSATNCSHNFGNKCKAGAINVNGSGALGAQGTNCATFVDRANSGFVNSINDCSTTETDNIRCEACNCVHNQNKACNASNVQIDFQNAHCDTFKLQ